MCRAAFSPPLSSLCRAWNSTGTHLALFHAWMELGGAGWAMPPPTVDKKSEYRLIFCEFDCIFCQNLRLWHPSSFIVFIYPLGDKFQAPSLAAWLSPKAHMGDGQAKVVALQQTVCSIATKLIYVCNNMKTNLATKVY